MRAICDEFGIVLIYDEIQTYARIGTFFAGEYYGVDPDIIVLGKGLGAGFPIGAIIIRDTLEGFSPETEELHTFANNSVSQVAGLKLIDELENGVLANCRAMGERIGRGLREMQKEFPVIGDVRQAGLHIGVELVKDPETPGARPRAVRRRAEEGAREGDHLRPGRHGQERAQDQAAAHHHRGGGGHGPAALPRLPVRGDGVKGRPE